MTRARRGWLFLHRYAGLSVGMLLVLLGLSGSIVTYRHELDALLHPALLTTRPGATRLSLDALAAAAQESMPPGASLKWARLPHEPHAAVSWFYADAEGTAWEMTSDPYTGSVLGRRRSDGHALALIHEFHATLLSGLLGNVVLGIVAVAVLWLVGAGAWLWWPRRGRWRQALTVKANVGPARLHFDLHRVVGAYAAPLLLVSAFTGIYMALPPVMNALVSLVAPVTAAPARHAGTGAGRLSLDEAVAAAQRHFPGAQPRVLVLPEGPQEVYEINLHRPGDKLWRTTGEWTAHIDPVTGAALHLDSPIHRTPGDRFIAWMFPLHNGEAFGQLSRVVTCALGVVPLLMAATGMSIWWRRRRQRAMAPAQAAPDAVATAAAPGTEAS